MKLNNNKKKPLLEIKAHVPALPSSNNNKQTHNTICINSSYAEALNVILHIHIMLTVKIKFYKIKIKFYNHFKLYHECVCDNTAYLGNSFLYYY